MNEWLKQGEVWETTHQCLEQVAQSNKEFANKYWVNIFEYQPGGVWLASRDLKDINWFRDNEHTTDL